jgi:hypothetical protein
VESPSKLFGAVLGLTAFAIAVIAGLASGVDAASIMKRGIVAMLACYGVGAALGAVAGHAIREYLEDYERTHQPADLAAAMAMYDDGAEEVS